MTQKDLKLVPYKIVKASSGDAWVEADGTDYSPSQISAFILHQDEGDGGEPISARPSPRPSSPFPPISTTPSARRPRTPASIAGLEVLRIINEPTAAALAYGLDKKQAGTIAVYRPRRRHLRRVDPGDRRRRLRGEVDQRRHLPRRRGLRHAPRRLPGGRVQEGAGHRPEEGQARAPAPEGSRREGQDRAVVHGADRDQPALHHGRCLGSEASHHQADPRQAGAAWSTI